VHEQPEGYGHQPQGQDPGGYPPQQPPPDPGQPSPQQPYGQPYGGQPQWGQPGGPGGFGPQPPMGPGGWGPPPPGPPGKGSSGPVIAVAAVAAVVLLGGGGAIVWALSDGGSDHKNPPVAVSTPPTSVPTYSPPGLPSAFPTPSFPTPSFSLPSSSPTLDQSMIVQAGDCVRIAGKTPNLKMFKTDCDSSKTQYKVLKRFSGTSDRTKCRGVSGYTTAFWAKSKKYSFLSYVICLKHQ
jgi:hypothetical protein